MIIDYSAWRAWKSCPAEWYEKYINRRQPRWPRRDREDALCLGSLVHAGLEQWALTHTLIIPEKVIEEMTPSRETLFLAQELVWGYSRAYPEERWPLILCEEPLQWALTPTLTGLAKIDAYFHVPEPTEIESGQPGLTFTLSPGWWIHEYKTKSPDIDLGLFMKKWAQNYQASFQMLALQHHLQGGEVQGVLVNVLEKPKKYIPRRKCKVCEELYEYAMWLPTGEGEYSCPVCGNRQRLAPLKENPVERPRNYYRISVTRTVAQLKKAAEDMVIIGERMERMEREGLESEEWNTESCVRYKAPCPYFLPHLYGRDTKENELDFQDVPDYRGLDDTLVQIS